MRAVGIVICGGRGLQHALQFLALTVLALYLVFEQGNLPGQLPVGIMRFVGFGFGITNAAFHDGLVDGVAFRCFLGGEPSQMNNRLMARNIISFSDTFTSVWRPRAWVLRPQAKSSSRNEFELAVKLFFIGGAHDGCTQLFQGLEDLCVYVESDEMKRNACILAAAWALIFGMTVGRSGPVVFMPS